MKKIENLEIIHLTTVEGKLEALLSYQDLDSVGDLNNGYNVVRVPVTIRELQHSIRGNVLVDQSVKKDAIFVMEELKS